MTSRVLLKRRAGSSGAPLLADLQAGELAINVRDGLLYAIRDAGSPAVIIIGAETSPALAAALKETTGGAFMSSLGLTLPNAPVLLSSVATSSGSSFDVTGIPAWANRIDVMFDMVSLSGSDNLLVQIGDSGGIETTGYVSGSLDAAASNGFIIKGGFANNGVIGIMRIVRASADGTRWLSDHATMSGTTPSLGSPSHQSGGGSKTLSAALDRLRLTRSGTNTFDGGSFVVSYRE